MFHASRRVHPAWRGRARVWERAPHSYRAQSGAAVERRRPGTRNQEPGTRNQEPGTRNQEPLSPTPRPTCAAGCVLHSFAADQGGRIPSGEKLDRPCKDDPDRDGKRQGDAPYGQLEDGGGPRRLDPPLVWFLEQRMQRGFPGLGFAPRLPRRHTRRAADDSKTPSRGQGRIYRLPRTKTQGCWVVELGQSGVKTHAPSNHRSPSVERPRAHRVHLRQPARGRRPLRGRSGPLGSPLHPLARPLCLLGPCLHAGHPAREGLCKGRGALPEDRLLAVLTTHLRDI